MEDTTATAQVRCFAPNAFSWDEVNWMAYKEEGAAPFHAISRQVLFAGLNLDCELRYFEMAAGGYSTLEQHGHAHAVMVLRGQGHCLLGDRVQAVKPYDLVTIPGWTWHQFRATGGEPLGFLCMVNAERDRPRLPTAEELAALRRVPAVAAFLDGTTDADPPTTDAPTAA